MRIQRAAPPFLFLACLLAWALVIALSSTASEAASPTVFTPLGQLAAIPGLTPAQYAVATAMDIFCPQLRARRSALNAAQTDLLNQCTSLQLNAGQNQNPLNTSPFFYTTVNPGSFGLSNEGLADALGQLTPRQAIAIARNNVEAAPNQTRITSRLVALRGGAGSQVILGGREFTLDGKEVRAGQPLPLNQTGGGASADRATPGRLGLWLNGNGSFGDHNSTQNEPGYSYHTGGFTGGVDYRLTDNLVLGAAFSYFRSNASFGSALGSTYTWDYGPTFYGTYYAGGFHIDLNGGFTVSFYDVNRNIAYGGNGMFVNREAFGSMVDLDGWSFNGNLGVGYDWKVNGFTLSPYGRIEYLNFFIDSYIESGASGLDLLVGGQRVQSLLSVLGGQVSYAWSVPFGVLSPYVRGEWRHEYLNNPRSITSRFLNDPTGTPFFIPTNSPSRNYADIGGGVSAQFAKGFSAFLSFDAIVGLTNFTNYQFAGGLRLALF